MDTPYQPLLDRVEQLVVDLFPNGKRMGSEYKVGDTSGTPGESLAIQLTGPNAGLWKDRATGVGGNLVTLIREAKGLKDGKPTWDWIRSYLGIKNEPYRNGDMNPLKMPWKREGKGPDLFATAAWPYHDVDGNVIAYACRMEFKNESGKLKKDVIPLRHIDNQWRWKGWKKPDLRPLFNLHTLAQRPDDAVLIVEGEKTAAAAAKLFPDLVAITWMGGAGNVSTAEYEPLVGRKLVLWPDADKEGRDAMLYLRSRFKTARMVDTSTLPEKWDLADPVPDGISIKGLLDAALKHQPVEQLPFRCLGYDHGTYYYLPSQTQQVLGLSAAGHTQAGLLQLAPLEYWRSNYSTKTGMDWSQATDDLMQTCHKSGVFHPTKVRGVGVWKDDKRTIFHAGDMLYIDGVQTPITSFKSRFIYELSHSRSVDLSQILSDHCGSQFLDICHSLPFKRQLDASLMAGWIVTAAICGYLPWRSHIWLTGPRGCGKSWILERIINAALGELICRISGTSTEAGTRQMMGQSALPVSYDEAENERQKDVERMMGILNLARCGSSDSSAEQVKGTASGNAIGYKMRSAWCFGSIGASIQMAADASRISMLELIPSKDEARFQSIVSAVANLIGQPSFSSRFIARAIHLAPTIEANFYTFSSILAVQLKDKRAADQLSTLLAGAYSLESQITLTESEAKDYLVQFKLAESAVETTSLSDEESCLNHLMDAKLMTDNKMERSVMELLTEWFSSSDDASREQAKEVLMRHGIKPSQDCFMVCHLHSSLCKVFSTTAWSLNFSQILERIKDAKRTTARYGMGYNPRRSVSVPWLRYTSPDE